MNIAHNFSSVADAPLCLTDIGQLVRNLSIAADENKYYSIVSKQSKPGYTTTAYSESGHVLYRARHSKSIQQVLRFLSDEQPEHIRLLSAQEAY